jgi:hypothetical protein
MDLLGYYPDLKGSFGRIRVRLRQEMLDQLCALLKAQVPNRVHYIRVNPSGKNRFRIFAELSNPFFHWFGQLFLHVLGESGIQIQIDQTTAVPGNPFQGRLVTTMIGQSVVTSVVDSINQELKAGNVIRVESELFGETRLSLDPFPILRKYLPAGIGDHLTVVRGRLQIDDGRMIRA